MSGSVSLVTALIVEKKEAILRAVRFSLTTASGLVCDHGYMLAVSLAYTKGELTREYEISFDGYKENEPVGQWSMDEVLPFEVPGRPEQDFPRMVVWNSIDEFEAMGLPTLVSGAFGWELVRVEYFMNDNVIRKQGLVWKA